MNNIINELWKKVKALIMFLFLIFKYLVIIYHVIPKMYDLLSSGGQKKKKKKKEKKNKKKRDVQKNVTLLLSMSRGCKAPKNDKKQIRLVQMTHAPKSS